MNRSLLYTLLLSTLPAVVGSWMLLPRGYNSFFGPSVFDTMLAPAWTTTVPSTTSLLRKFMEETNSLLPPSVPYEYQNYDTNVTIRLPLPAGLSPEHVQVQFDEEHQVLTIRGKQEEETDHTPHDDAAMTTPRSRRVMEFSQSFALDPDRMQLEHVTAAWDDNHVLTIVVPKRPEAVEPPSRHIRTIPILTASETAETANGAAPVVTEATVH
jgi:HSP20 family molecular chaperone IbpA